MKIVDWNELPELGVSHDPSIKKKTLINRGEIHGQHNPFDQNVTWTYFGIATD